MEEKLKIDILDIIKETFGLELLDIKLSKPPKKEMGDFAFNCGILSKDLKKNPAIIAGDLIEELKNISEVDDVTSNGGFINIKLSKDIYTNLLNTLYQKKENLIDSSVGKNKTIVVDYIGANVGKPLHIGHMCTPNQGQVLVNLYDKLGYNIISDSHIGDWGIIFGRLIWAWKNSENFIASILDNSELLYYQKKKGTKVGLYKYILEEKLKQEGSDFLMKLYQKSYKIRDNIRNESIDDIIRNEFKLLSEGNSESVKLWKEFTKYSIEAMQVQLDRLNIKSKYNIGESFYEGLGLPKMEDFPDLKFDMHSVVNELIKEGIAIKNEDNSVGVVFDEKLKVPSCILQKRDGTHGYLASDLAGIKYRMNNWAPEKIIYFVDSRQQLHLKQAFIIAENAGWINKTELFHAFNGFISLKDGAMSTRKGRIIKLDKLLDEAESRAEKIILEKRDDIKGDELKKLSKKIGIGAIKYGYLKKNRETDIIFDWDEFMTFEGNSGPYIQYAYVRANRILENYGAKVNITELGNLEYSEEIELVKIISNYNNVLLEVANSNSPHILCKYAYELTKTFNSFYNSIHILNEENEGKKIIRLKLIELFTIVLRDSFDILAIEMPDKM